MNKVIFEFKLPTDQLIRVVQGALITETTDAIVNSANSNLQHERGMSKIISRHGGPTIQHESDNLIQKCGQINPGRVVITTAGQLPAKFIIHAIGPTMSDDDPKNLLTSAIRNSLFLADSYNLRSISIPNISAHVFPIDVSAKLIIRTVFKYLRKNPGTSLKEIRFCHIDGPTATIYSEKAKELLSKY